MRSGGSLAVAGLVARHRASSKHGANRARIGKEDTCKQLRMASGAKRLGVALAKPRKSKSLTPHVFVTLLVTKSVLTSNVCNASLFAPPDKLFVDRSLATSTQEDPHANS